PPASGPGSRGRRSPARRAGGAAGPVRRPPAPPPVPRPASPGAAAGPRAAAPPAEPRPVPAPPAQPGRPGPPAPDRAPRRAPAPPGRSAAAPAASGPPPRSAAARGSGSPTGPRAARARPCPAPPPRGPPPPALPGSPRPFLSCSALACTAPGPAVRRARLPSVHSAPDSALRCARNRLGPVPRSSRLRSEAAQQAAEQPAEADHRLSELLGPDTARPVPAGGVAGPPVAADLPPAGDGEVVLQPLPAPARPAGGGPGRPVAADLPRVVDGEAVLQPLPARVAPLGRDLGDQAPGGADRARGVVDEVPLQAGPGLGVRRPPLGGEGPDREPGPAPLPADQLAQRGALAAAGPHGAVVLRAEALPDGPAAPHPGGPHGGG